MDGNGAIASFEASIAAFDGATHCGNHRSFDENWFDDAVSSDVGGEVRGPKFEKRLAFQPFGFGPAVSQSLMISVDIREDVNITGSVRTRQHRKAEAFSTVPTGSGRSRNPDLRKALSSGCSAEEIKH